MGHFHAKNLSQHLFHLFFTEMFEHKKDEHGDVRMSTAKRIPPRPIPKAELLTYFVSRINACMEAIKNIEDSWGKELLIELIGNEWGNRASEGIYTDDGMIDMGIGEIIAYWQDPKCWNGITVVEGDDKKGYHFSEAVIADILNSEDGLKKYIIEEIEL